jgi:hypothetical protein
MYKCNNMQPIRINLNAPYSVRMCVSCIYVYMLCLLCVCLVGFLFDFLGFTLLLKYKNNIEVTYRIVVVPCCCFVCGVACLMVLVISLARLLTWNVSQLCKVGYTFITPYGRRSIIVCLHVVNPFVEIL